MLRLVLFFSIVVVKGKEALFSMLAMLEKISLALTPELEKLNRSEENKTDELDTLAKQWSGMWDTVTDRLSFRKSGKKPVRELLALAERQSRLNIQVADFNLLSHSCVNSSIAQMLSCQRNMGDPAAAYLQLFTLTTCLSLSSTSHQNSQENKLALHLENVLVTKQEIYRIKAQKALMPLLCFFYFIQVKINEVNYVFCLCSGLSNRCRTYLYGGRITGNDWKRIRA